MKNLRKRFLNACCKGDVLEENIVRCWLEAEQEKRIYEAARKVLKANSKYYYLQWCKRFAKNAVKYGTNPAEEFFEIGGEYTKTGEPFIVYFN